MESPISPRAAEKPEPRGEDPLDQRTPQKLLHQSFIALAMRSAARMCIIPLQDYLGLDNSCRINT
ncbi:MAG: hypothetical protein IJ952_04085, partial [Alistipes sp.]|nr:hypothetical protein [Alistipes sp.]